MSILADHTAASSTITGSHYHSNSWASCYSCSMLLKDAYECMYKANSATVASVDSLYVCAAVCWR